MDLPDGPVALCLLSQITKFTRIIDRDAIKKGIKEESDSFACVFTDIVASQSSMTTSGVAGAL